MLLILAGAAPLAAMAVTFLICRTSSRPDTPTGRRAFDGSSDLAPEDRWEGLSAEVARLERRRSPVSDAATRRRHLAAVLPADARR
ncbi:MAG TPA: hypothetical protein VKV21_16680 [Solirubrobacteraceae bacterium]|nr:hypothetical protein [Solirubrobacteraceae bacterium]